MSMDYEKLHKDTLAGLQRLVLEGKITEETARSICADFVAESEDERIRKWIKKELESKYVVDNIVNNTMADKAFAYLEKQKEQKDYRKLYEDIAKSEWFKKAYKGKSLGCDEEQKVQKPFSQEVFDAAKHEALWGEQKPAEWSEEDKTNGWTGVDSERYISCLQRLGTGNPQQPETINSKWFKEHCRPQPKQEWSEKDEENFKWFDKLFRAESIVIGGRDIPQDKYLWFKSLRPVKQEWSGYDEKMRDEILDFFRTRSTKWYDWILTLPMRFTPQPHWKPSEEQMNALKETAEWKKYSNPQLFSLYEQLKKL